MVKCPFCQFDNEDGALFCEQCKSDLGLQEAIPVGVPVEAMAVAAAADAPPVVEEPAAAALAEAVPACELPTGADAQLTTTAEHIVPAAALPPGAQPKLVVLRGVKIGVEYPLYEGLNFIGRMDEKPVDIDLEDQEHPDRIWSSRQHACISFENGVLSLEDLNSANGTFVNRTRVYPGQKRPLNLGDVVQIGTVQMRVKA